MDLSQFVRSCYTRVTWHMYRTSSILISFFSCMCSVLFLLKRKRCVRWNHEYQQTKTWNHEYNQTKTSFGLLILVVPPYTSFCMYHLPKSAHEGCPRLSFTSFHIHHSFRVTLSIPRISTFFILCVNKYISQKPPLVKKKTTFSVTFFHLVLFFCCSDVRKEDKV